MIIRGIHIEGFGVYGDWRVDDLSGGTTVFFGPNEAGKSTLMNFIAGALFGFPKKNSAEVAYIPALKGGNHGGRLILEDLEGRAWTIERFYAKKASLVGLDGGRSGEEEIGPHLGNFDGASYRAVFGFDLKALEELRALGEEKVRERLYSATVQGAGESVAQASSRISTEMAEIFKPKGQGGLNLAAKNLKEIESERSKAEALSESYAEKRAALEKSRLRIKELSGERKRVGAGAERLKLLQGLKPLHIELEEAKRTLDGFPADLPFPEGGMGRLEVLLAGVRKISAELQKKKADAESLRKRVDGLSPDKKRLESLPALRALAVAAGGIAARLAALDQARSERDRAKAAVNRRLTELGEGWTAERIRAAEELIQKKEEARRLAEELAALREDSRLNRKLADDAEGRLKALEAEEDAEGAKKKRNAIYLSLGVALAISAAGYFMPDPYRHLAWGFAAALLILGAGGLLPRGASDGRMIREARSVAARLGTVAEASGKRHEESEAEWERRRLSWGFLGEGPCSPEAALEILQKIGEAKLDLADFDARARSIDSEAGEIARWESEAADTLESFGIEGRGLAGERLIETIARILRGEEKAEAEARAAGLSLAEAEAEVDRLTALMAVDAKEAEGLMKAAGVGDEEEFRRKGALHAKKMMLEGRVSELEGKMAAQLGAAGGELLEDLKSGSAAGWTMELAELEEERKRLEGEHDGLMRSAGALEAEISSIEASTALSRIDAEIAALKAEGAASAKRWRILALARELMRLALQKFALERQPGVLAEATLNFSSVTGGRYRRVLQPLGGSEIAVERDDGVILGVDALSRGTREELYLSLRLALAADFCSRGARLPLLADDVFVNFDPERAKKAIAEVCRFAQNGQALVFTCHPETVERFVAACPSVKVVNLDPGQGPGVQLGA